MPGKNMDLEYFLLRFFDLTIDQEVRNYSLHKNVVV
jgi:hypothetical protein